MVCHNLNVAHLALFFQTNSNLMFEAEHQHILRRMLNEFYSQCVKMFVLGCPKGSL